MYSFLLSVGRVSIGHREKESSNDMPSTSSLSSQFSEDIDLTESTETMVPQKRTKRQAEKEKFVSLFCFDKYFF